MMKATDVAPQTPQPQVDSVGVVTPLHKTQHRKSSTDSDSRSTMGSDIDVTAATNQDLLVTVRETTTGSDHAVVMVLISNVRPATYLGKKQGDHVTAYQAFLEMLISSVEGYELKEAIDLIIKTAKAVMPMKSEVFDTFKVNIEEQQKQGIDRSERKRVIHALENQGEPEDFIKRTKDRLIADRRNIFMKAMEMAGQALIKEINLEEDIAFSRKGISDTREGARVKRATHGLRVASDLIEYLRISDLASADKGRKEKILDRYYERYLKVGSKFKDGANAIFTTDSIHALNRAWSKKSYGDKRVSLEALREKITIEQISRFMGDLFDYGYEVHMDSPKEILYKVVAKHFIVMLNAFNCLDYLSADELLDEFLKTEVLDKQGWNEYLIPQELRELEFSDLSKGVRGIADIAKKEMCKDEGKPILGLTDNLTSKSTL